MSLTKSQGNMYDWVTHTHSHLRGKCSHECEYCYVQALAKRFPNMAKKYSGEIRLDRKELDVNYGKGNLIFVEHMNDLFADAVDDKIVYDILNHCLDFPDSDYVFQTKNPARMLDFIGAIPNGSLLGTTIESNRIHSVMGNAPSPFVRMLNMIKIGEAGENKGIKTFITIEPILAFDLNVFAEMIANCHPHFVNIGADSKDHGLDEPTYDEIMALYEALIDDGIEVRKKINMQRLQRGKQ